MKEGLLISNSTSCVFIFEAVSHPECQSFKEHFFFFGSPGV
jgi:hypothetical protein